jgi:hypothetical protein
VKEAFTESGRQRVPVAVGQQAYGILRAFENGCAMAAILEVEFHANLELRLDLSIKIAGNLSPYLNTTNLNDCGFHTRNSLIKEITTA